MSNLFFFISAYSLSNTFEAAATLTFTRLRRKPTHRVSSDHPAVAREPRHFPHWDRHHRSTTSPRAGALARSWTRACKDWQPVVEPGVRTSQDWQQQQQQRTSVTGYRCSPLWVQPILTKPIQPIRLNNPNLGFLSSENNNKRAPGKLIPPSACPKEKPGLCRASED